MKDIKSGIIDICDSLVTDLIKFLKDEGRYKFRMIGYISKISRSFESLYNDQTDEEIEEYERFIYLMSKSIYHDYKRLRSRKLSPADSVICIISKLLEYVNDCSPVIKETFKMFYDNIKNRAKQDKLMKIENTLLQAIQNGETGKLRLSDINLYSIEHPAPRIQEITESTEKWSESNEEEIKL